MGEHFVEMKRLTGEQT